MSTTPRRSGQQADTWRETCWHGGWTMHDGKICLTDLGASQPRALEFGGVRRGIRVV